MKEFPLKLNPKNCHLFPQMKFNIALENWRIKTFNYILNDQKNGLELYEDNNNNLIDNRIIDCIRFELKNLGWKTSLAYNGTVLFIYEKDIEIEKYKNSLCEETFE